MPDVCLASECVPNAAVDFSEHLREGCHVKQTHAGSAMHSEQHWSAVVVPWTSFNFVAPVNPVLGIRVALQDAAAGTMATAPLRRAASMLSQRRHCCAHRPPKNILLIRAKVESRL